MVYNGLALFKKFVEHNNGKGFDAYQFPFGYNTVHKGDNNDVLGNRHFGCIVGNDDVYEEDDGQFNNIINTTLFLDPEPIFTNGIGADNMYINVNNGTTPSVDNNAHHIINDHYDKSAHHLATIAIFTKMFLMSYIFFLALTLWQWM